MEYGFWSHALLWLIGAMAALGALGTVLAFWSLGRQAYKDWRPPPRRRLPLGVGTGGISGHPRHRPSPRRRRRCAS